MTLATLFFFLYSILFIFATIMVIGSNNPIHSVLFLVLAFFNAAGLLLLLEAEFLAMMFLIIYVGAIAVLFLFVVMMLNIKIVVSNFNLLRYLPLGGLIGIVFFLQISSIFWNVDGISLLDKVSFDYNSSPILFNNFWNEWIILQSNSTQIEVVGNLLYAKAYDLFIMAGIILFIAMVGAILLTLHPNSSKSQSIAEQIVKISKINLSR